MSNYVFIADYFVDEVLGGGELNNEELVNILSYKNNIYKIKSSSVTSDFIEKNNNAKFIIANFALLSEESKQSLLNKNYIIYEHDHKYIKSRNPADFKNFKAPQEQIINKDFYQNARAVLCQSTFHKNIIDNNLNKVNTISLSGNLWSIEVLNLIEELSTKDKIDKYAIMSSNIQHKNSNDAVKLCLYKNYEYVLIPSMPYKHFLTELSKYTKLIFFPKTPETLSRIAVEARMMNMSVITNSNVGASHEKWFSLKGKNLIDLMRHKRDEIPFLIESILS